MKQRPSPYPTCTNNDSRKLARLRQPFRSTAPRPNGTPTARAERARRGNPRPPPPHWNLAVRVRTNLRHQRRAGREPGGDLDSTIFHCGPNLLVRYSLRRGPTESGDRCPYSMPTLETKSPNSKLLHPSTYQLLAARGERAKSGAKRSQFSLFVVPLVWHQETRSDWVLVLPATGNAVQN